MSKISKKIDACGLACPQPVLLLSEAMKSGGCDEIEIRVDNQASRENVGRAALSQGWEVVASEESGEEFVVKVKKK